MPILLEDVGRDFQRFRHTPEEKLLITRTGLTHVLSSNVSAVGTTNGDLIIRFHNGSLYRYFNQGNRFNDIMRSNSKGKWVWRNLRRKPVRYERIGQMPFPEDLTLTDEELFGVLDRQFDRLGELLGATLLNTVTDDNTGLTVRRFSVGGLILSQVVKPS